MSHHPPFKQVRPPLPLITNPAPRTGHGSLGTLPTQVEGSRPEFDAKQQWSWTKARPSLDPPSPASTLADGIH